MDVIYLFDTLMHVRRVITKGIAQCIHGERDHTLNAEIPATHNARPGEYLGFRCVDGRFRLFAIEYADNDDLTATSTITARDAAVDELAGTIITLENTQNATAQEAVAAIAAKTAFTIGENEAGRNTASAKGGMMSAWSALSEAESAYNLFFAPYYEFDGKEITARILDVLAKKKTYRGRFVEAGSDASGIVVTYGERPRPMIYGLGQDGLTIESVAWSKANGDPTDKPAGQPWIGVADAMAKYPGRGQVYELQDVSDAGELTRKCWEKAQEAAKPTVSGTALISDMEMAAGQSYKAVRLWDLAHVRPKFGEDLKEQIIDIKRNYVREDQTKIALGKEKASSAKQVASLIKTATATSRTAGGNSRGLSAVQTGLADTNVRLYELDGYTHTEISNVLIQLSAQEAAILLKAERTDLSELENELRAAEIRIDGAEAELMLKASVETVSGLESELSEAYVRINGLESEIELKADLITLDGYVTASRLSAEIATINKFFSGASTISIAAVNTLRCSYANMAYLYVNGTEASWKSFKAVTGGKVNFSTASVTVTEGMTLRIPSSFSFAPYTDWIYYLGRD